MNGEVLASTSWWIRSGRPEAEPLPDHPAERQAAEVHALQSEDVQQLQHVAAQAVEGVRARRGLRLAVAAAVVAQHAKARGERGQLRIPHLQPRAEGVGEQQHRALGRAIQPVGQSRAISEGRETRAASPRLRLRDDGSARAIRSGGCSGLRTYAALPDSAHGNRRLDRAADVRSSAPGCSARARGQAAGIRASSFDLKRDCRGRLAWSPACEERASAPPGDGSHPPPCGPGRWGSVAPRSSLVPLAGLSRRGGRWTQGAGRRPRACSRRSCSVPWPATSWRRCSSADSCRALGAARHLGPGGAAFRPDLRHRPHRPGLHRHRPARVPARLHARGGAWSAPRSADGRACWPRPSPTGSPSSSGCPRKCLTPSFNARRTSRAGHPTGGADSEPTQPSGPTHGPSSGGRP